ncbi:MAG: FliH/SctL family protein [Rhodospirillaceae bacterium]|nr:FliH/SctL family protein [Rhodospirillaceae bacterium]
MSPVRSAAKRFMFDRSFDDPGRLYLPGELRRAELEAERAAAEAAEATADDASMADAPTSAVQDAPAPPPEPMYTKAELDAAREEGHIAGHAAALEEAETAREHYIADAIALIGQGLAQLDEQQKAANAALGETAMRLVYAVLAKIVPPHAQSYAVDNIGAFVTQVLPVVMGEPKLVVRVHNLIVPDVQTRLQQAFERSGFQGAYTVVADYELQPGDCRLEWAGGGADRSEARVWAEIREIIAASFGDVDVAALDRAADTERAADQVAAETANPDSTKP